MDKMSPMNQMDRVDNMACIHRVNWMGWTDRIDWMVWIDAMVWMNGLAGYTFLLSVQVRFILNTSIHILDAFRFHLNKQGESREYIAKNG